MDYLESLLATEEVHECNSKKCLTALKKQFEKFLADTLDCKNEERAFQEFLQEKNYVVNTQGFRDLILRYLEGIEKGIDARVSHEEVLRIKERDVKERRKNKERMIEFEIMRLEKMIQKDKCSNPGEDMDATRAKHSKKKCMIHFRLLHTLLEYLSKEDLTNACFSTGFHRAFSSLFGKDALKNQLQQFITMQISMDSDDHKTNHFFTEYTLCDAQMFQNILISLMDSIEKAITERGLYKRVHDSRVNERTMQTYEDMISKDASEIDNNVEGASHDKDNITEFLKWANQVNLFVCLQMNKACIGRKMALGYTDPCPLGQAIACHPKLYDAEVLGLHYVKPDVHETMEILNDAEESQVKMKEKQF
ncbi:hypothetical protein Tco_1538496 [Tanacetum coccineum]